MEEWNHKHQLRRYGTTSVVKDGALSMNSDNEDGKRYMKSDIY